MGKPVDVDDDEGGNPNPPPNPAEGVLPNEKGADVLNPPEPTPNPAPNILLPPTVVMSPVVPVPVLPPPALPAAVVVLAPNENPVNGAVVNRAGGGAMDAGPVEAPTMVGP